jgi:ABC-type nitrate/sulfonate/bicarbonate transport system permease component
MTATDVPALDTPDARAGLTSSRRRFSVPSSALGLLGLVGFAVLLELLPRVGLVSEDYFPPLSAMFSAMVTEVQTAGFWAAMQETLMGWGIGLAVALVAGITLGLLLGSVEVLRRYTASTIEFLRPVPSVALIPLAVLLFGFQLQSTLLLVVYAAFWQVLIQVLYGVQDVDPVASDTARAYSFPLRARIRYVIWPTALPYIMTGLRLSAAVALILAVTAELVIGNPGIGNRIAVAQSSGAIEATYALVVVAGIVGVIVNLVFRYIERRTLSWHPSQRAEVAL